jgi:two-component system, cell cycle sensor histidine kinase and response regulator CckA
VDCSEFHDWEDDVGDNRNDMTMDDYKENRLAKFYLDRASVYAFRLDQDGRILYANHKACGSLGYSQTELLNMSVFDIDTGVNREIWPSMWQKLCDVGSETFESQHRRKDGTVFPIEVTVTLIEFEGCRYSIALTKDITEGMRLNESLRIRQFIFDKAPLGIFLIKDGGHIADVNEHTCQYLGYSKEELCQMNVMDIDCGFSPQEIDQVWARQLDKGSIDTFETVHRGKDGTKIPVEISGILLEFNNIPYSVSFAKDISERKEAEKQRLKMEAQIRESQRIESLGTLAGGIAHDFNNILSAILGYAQLAQLECQVDSNLRKYVSEIFKAGNRAKELVQQILLFSRQGHSKKGPMDMSRVVDEALKLIKATLPANIAIMENISHNLAPVFANEIQIHQIVMNLCTNAHHAIKTTDGMLDVSLKAISLLEQDAQNNPGLKPGSYIRLSIGDNGCGIPPDIINRIFEPYYTTKPTGEGTGLGLSTVHGIVKDHGGCIKVYSEAGVGTAFHVFLPAADTATETVVQHADQLPTGNECILLVDDEKALIDLGRDLLERLGYQVETRTSSIDAIEAFRSNFQKYNLVISDMTMPKMTGDEIALLMKAIRPDIPIILCSGFSDRINAQTMKSIGISAVLMKPVLYADLAHTIRQVLDAD